MLGTNQKQGMQAICDMVIVWYGPILGLNMGREYMMVLHLFWNKKSRRNNYKWMANSFKMLLMWLLFVNGNKIKIMQHILMQGALYLDFSTWWNLKM
jgi:hypothetical protein